MLRQHGLCGGVLRCDRGLIIVDGGGEERDVGHNGVVGVDDLRL